MEKQIDILEQTRQNILSITAALSIEQLNTVPRGFNNNLIWNMGHCLVTPTIIGVRADREFLLGSSRYDCPLPAGGTKPEGAVGEEETATIRSLLASTPALVLEDYRQGKFQTFREYATLYGVTLYQVEDALRFNVVHEAMHLGYMMAQKRLV